ncbi:MAG: hypothetical protein HN350_13465 [Phycisphaerales bacterium]|nr:hypothetical protein [Phycisphaerales bacterium]
MLALLLSAVYGYWYFTNASRIRSQAESYLREITGAEVHIKKANFSLFGDITLEGVRINVPGEKGFERFFSSPKVILKHRPWSVFVSGTIHPTAVVAMKAEVTNSPATRAFISARRPSRDGPSGPMILPVVQVGSCTYKLIEIVGGIRNPPKTFDLGIDMIPYKQGQGYNIHIAERKTELKDEKEVVTIAQMYKVAVQLSPAYKVKLEKGRGDLMATTSALPLEYRKWIEAYDIQGKYKFHGDVSVSDQAIEGSLTLTLYDAAFKLPKAQGGLTLTNVSGVLVFTPPDKSPEAKFKNGRIEMQYPIVGKVVEAGGVAVELSGEYLGYSLDSPFKVKIAINEMTLPMRQAAVTPQTAPAATRPSEKLHPTLKGILELIERDYNPVGTAKMVLELSRAPGQGDLAVKGLITPLKLSALYRHVPYRMDVISGQARFDNTHLYIEKIVARQDDQGVAAKRDEDKGKFTVDVVSPLKPDSQTGKWKWNATIHCDKIDMTEALARALPKQAFPGKPYPLKNISGFVYASAEEVLVDQDEPLHADGPDAMDCRLDGSVQLNSKDPKFNVHIEADNVPVDSVLIDSLPSQARSAVLRLSPSGTAESLSVRVKKSPETKLSYDVTVGIKGVTAKYKDFPYSLTGLTGKIKVNTGIVELAKLTAMHGETSFDLNGMLYPLGKTLGVNLTVNAKAVPIDKDLHQALPEAIQKIWDSLKPKGQADIALTLKQNLPGKDDKLDYTLEISPKGMSLLYDGFPYPVDGVRGLITAKPGLVTLSKIECDSKYKLDGLVKENGRILELKINAKGVPLDKTLLAAMPAEFETIMKNVKPGGTLDINVENLTITHPKPSSGTTTRPTTRTKPAQPQWKVKGQLGLHNTTLDFVMGVKKVNGKLDGNITQDSSGLAMNVDAVLDKIAIGAYEITNVKGALAKKSGSPLVRIEDLEARVYGGRLAGREVMIRFSDPMKYAFSLFYQNVDMGSLVNASVKNPKARSEVKGLLEGKISLEATVGDPKSRRAAGTVIITKGKMYKMPIMLGLMHVLYLSLPTDSAFTDGHLKYFVQGEKMVMEEIFLTGSAMSLVGSGKMTMSDEKLDLTFLTGPPGKLPRIAVIRKATKVLNSLLKELLVIRITGTLSRPIRKAVPLRSIDGILKELLSPGRNR